jgi:hypothetical protein
MAVYAALLYYPEDRYWTDPEEVETVLPEYRVFHDAATAAGVERGAAALHPVGTATTVTVAEGKGGEVVVTDGPYAEAKEVLGGLVLIEVEDLDEAIRWAARIPTAWRGKVELRPVVPVPTHGSGLAAGR